MGEIPGETDKKLSDNHKQIPTGITQNVKDLLSSREVENIFENIAVFTAVDDDIVVHRLTVETA